MENISKTAIGSRFKEVRNTLKKLQGELAEEIGITGPSLSAIEKGYSYPSIETVLSFAKQCQVDLNWLLLGSGNIELRSACVPDHSECLNIIKILTDQNKLLLDTLFKCKNLPDDFSQPIS